MSCNNRYGTGKRSPLIEFFIENYDHATDDGEVARTRNHGPYAHAQNEEIANPNETYEEDQISEL